MQRFPKDFSIDKRSALIHRTASKTVFTAYTLISLLKNNFDKYERMLYHYPPHDHLAAVAHNIFQPNIAASLVISSHRKPHAAS